MLSFFYIYLALNMSMLVTDCLKFISQISISCSVLSKDRIKGFFLKRSDRFKTFVWYGSLVSTCFQHLKHNIFKSGPFGCNRQSQA